MPFNNSKNGFQNENDFVNKLHNKKIKDLDYNLQLFIEDIFGNTNQNIKIFCYKNALPQKYDILIECKGVTKRISIKKGIKNSVHTEPISELIHFLIENKMPKELVIEFLKYHYADGTTNGTGKNRLSTDEYKKQNQPIIDEINKFLNSDSMLKKSIDRFIILGRNSKENVDAIIYGVPEDFIWILKNDIYKILLKKKDNYSSAIHFSSLTYQPLNRCLNYNPKYEKCRYISQIKWYNISDDIIENMDDNVMRSR